MCGFKAPNDTLEQSAQLEGGLLSRESAAAFLAARTSGVEIRPPSVLLVRGGFADEVDEALAVVDAQLAVGV